MKRDMDLVRKILMVMEEEEYHTAISENFLPKIEGYSEERILYHMEIMTQAGLLHMDRSEYPIDQNQKIITRFYSLSWEGHEFLDAARDSKRWEKAKRAMSQAGGFALDVMKQLLIQYLKTELKLP